MMLPPNIERLVNQIIIKTNRREIAWIQAYHADKVSMSNDLFSIDIGYGYDPERDFSYYYFDYTDQNGYVNRFLINEADGHFGLLKQAYDFAVASTLQIPDQW